MNSTVRYLLVSVMLLGGAALAQAPVRSGSYAGGAVKVGLLYDVCVIFASDCGGPSFGATAHVGAHDLIAPNVGGRASFGVTLARNLTYVQLAADALLEPDPDGSTVSPYVGGGLRVGWMTRYAFNPSMATVSGISFGAGVVGGVRFAVADRSSVYLEAGLDYLVTSLLVPTLAVGAEFGF